VDPNFPNRPTHPDIETLCSEAQTNDNLVDSDIEIDTIIGTFIDPESLAYLVINRAGRYLILNHVAPTIEMIELIGGAIVDGFVLGAGTERRKRDAS
jgi:hypothetical protein